MMFNGLPMRNDTDTSEFTKHSTGASGSESETRACSLQDSTAAARAPKSKDETGRVQAESPVPAEERLAAASRTRNCATGCHFDLTDGPTPQMQDNRELVKTLQDNLSVMEDLYRECFYETARQDEIIAVLRATCRDRPRQDVAVEVEHLKAELCNFLNNSTNSDSGVWEAGGGGGSAALELRGVEEQLQRLGAVLQAACTCGVSEESLNLKKINESMEIEIQYLRQKVSDLEEDLDNKNNLEQRYLRQIEQKEEELQHIKVQLSESERDSRDRGAAIGRLSSETKRLEGLLNDKTEELIDVQQRRVSQETVMNQLREELEKVNNISQENASVRREVCSLSARVAAWRRQLAVDAPPSARERRPHRAHHHAEQCTHAEELRGELREARAGGAALCARARAALHAARDGLRALARHARENEEIISQQELLIRSLREKSTKNISKRSSVSENQPCCSKYLNGEEMRSSDRSYTGAKETAGSKCSSAELKAKTSESDTANGSPPTPPRRLLRKKLLCTDRRCQWPPVREASVGRTPSQGRISSIMNRELSADSLLERVERTHEALELAHRRWCRHGHERYLADE